MTPFVSLIVEFAVRNTAGLILAGVLVVVAGFLSSKKTSQIRLVRSALAAVSVFWIVVLLVVFINHARFPLFLESLEGTVFQHFERAAHSQPIFPGPSPEFVPFGYNPLYYFVSVPFSWVFGESLFTLRLISILATIGIGALIFWILRRETDSEFWGLIGAGLFAASYQIMDSHLDTAHADACFVLCALAGTAVIYYNRSRSIRLLAMVVLIASFWFKQHGAIFAMGGLLFLTWDEGWRRSWPYWLLTLALGPVTYILLGPVLFGPYFHYFTYHVPAAWTMLSAHSFARGASLFIRGYCWISLAAVWWFVSQLYHRSWRPSIWQVQLVAAFATAVMGSLDEGSSNNVYIPLATWLVLCGTLGFNRLEAALVRTRSELVSASLAVVSFALLAFNPMGVMTSWRAQQDYREFVQYLSRLDGSVYAPVLGQLPDDYSFYPAAHFVALEDMIRGPNRDVRNHPLTREYLAPLLDPSRPVFILDNYPLSAFPSLDYLKQYFVLQEDLGDRFRSLRVLPARWDLKWPRFLYRLNPDALSAGPDLEQTAPSSPPPPQPSA